MTYMILSFETDQILAYLRITYEMMFKLFLSMMYNFTIEEVWRFLWAQIEVILILYFASLLHFMRQLKLYSYFY